MNGRTILLSIARLKINIVIKILIASDFILAAGAQLLTPIFAIFITDKLAGGSIEAVGIAAAIYLISKSIFEIPIGIFIDKTKSELDDFYTIVIGTFLSAFIYALFIFISDIWHLYALQILHGFAAALMLPGWGAIFTKHIDKGKEAFEWSLFDVIIGIGMAAAAALGGFLAQWFGFDILFVIISILTVAGGIVLIFIKNKLYIPKTKKR